jgi:hypothetical protein
MHEPGFYRRAVRLRYQHSIRDGRKAPRIGLLVPLSQHLLDHLGPVPTTARRAHGTSIAAEANRAGPGPGKHRRQCATCPVSDDLIPLDELG